MKEKALRELFINSLKSGHVKGNSYCLPRIDSNCDFSIKEEGYFRNFDLVLVTRRRHCSPCKSFQRRSSEFSADNLNIIMRSGLFTKFALKEKCRIDSITFYPIEIKSDQDTIDERLSHQVLNALLFFGRSIVVLDAKHCNEKRFRKLCRYLPATFIGYTGQEDYFNVISTFDRFISTNIYFLKKRSLAKLLVNNGVEPRRVQKIYRCLENILRINQKIAFSQVNFDRDIVLLPEEIEFIESLVDLSVTSNKTIANKLIKRSINAKITDFV
jgi:hypothetical protein